ncbi:hypothetical protein BD626DRAFT_119327 [Schizophyllum amplum]|uniref:Uncharacterized protein n=1 Tax=Schizophyllum amplum TaxID=97359 RepID=A0A550CV20_9AGAR|nr:hypothetical protein BD626DRAFT_119327 [Auriculariopsis ampla]
MLIDLSSSSSTSGAATSEAHRGWMPVRSNAYQVRGSLSRRIEVSAAGEACFWAEVVAERVMTPSISSSSQTVLYMLRHDPCLDWTRACLQNG